MNKTDNIPLLRGESKKDSLQRKVCQSMKLIESLYTGNEIVAHSGGKDSVVLADLVQRVFGNGVVPIVHAVTTRDPAGTISFLKENYPDIVLDMPSTNFGELVRKKGYPTRMTRFCCEKLKERVGKGKRVYFYDQSVGYDPVNVIHDPDCPCREKGGENE